MNSAFLRALQHRGQFFGRRLVSGSADISKAAEVKPTNFDKKLLVWFGKKYSRVEDIPTTVPSTSLSEVRTSFRIWTNVTTFVLALGGCIAAAQYGKQQHDMGKSLHGMAMDKRADYIAAHTEER